MPAAISFSVTTSSVLWYRDGRAKDSDCFPAGKPIRYRTVTGGPSVTSRPIRSGAMWSW